MTKAQLLADVKFLSKRGIGSGYSGKHRDYGMSSNSIVAIAYGLIKLKDQYFPSDASDMASCERMWKKLPKHRKQGDALKAMQAARKSDYYGKETQGRCGRSAYS
jgi:hypothetical protein